MDTKEVKKNRKIEVKENKKLRKSIPIGGFWFLVLAQKTTKNTKT